MGVNTEMSEDLELFHKSFKEYSDYIDSILKAIDVTIKDDIKSDEERIMSLIMIKIQIEKELFYLPKMFNAVSENNEFLEDPNAALLIVHKIRIEQILSNYYSTKKIVDMLENRFSLNRNEVKKGRTKNTDISNFSSPELCILLKLLYEKNIFIGDKKRFLDACESLTGLQGSSLNNDIWSALIPKRSKKKNCESVLNVLNEMKSELEKYIKNNYPE